MDALPGLSSDWSDMLAILAILGTLYVARFHPLGLHGDTEHVFERFAQPLRQPLVVRHRAPT